MLKQIAALSAFLLLVFAAPLAASEPLQLKIFVSDEKLHLRLTNISSKPVKVLPFFMYASESDPVPFRLAVFDARGNRLSLSHTVDVRSWDIPKNWTPLQPGKSTGTAVPFSVLAEDFRFRKEQYSVIATYSWTYRSEDDATHKIQLISNPANIVSKVDVDKAYCDAHYPDGRARYPGGLNVPRQFIEMHCR
jgi:hypothetical protein